MSGNKERLTMEISEDGFKASCPNCRDSYGFRFRSSGWRHSVRISWNVGLNRPEVYRKDWRTTKNSFQKHDLYCYQCRSLIKDVRVRKQAIDIVFKYGDANRW